MEDICTGCLCSGRKLYFISETGFYQLYSQILNEIPVQDMSQVCIRVCWECCALLQKFQLFKAQVKRNYTEMLWNIPPPSIPSRLATREVHNISYPGTFSTDQDTQVKGECIISTDIKTEVDENLEHQEPVTFVNDLQVEGSAEEPLKNSKRKPKHKKPGKNKIKVKKKKKGKALILPAAVQSDGVSDTEYPLEDTFQEDRIEENTKEDCDKNLDVVKKKEVVKKLLKVTAKVPKSSIHVPVLRLPKAESIPKTPSAELLPKTPSAELLSKTPSAEVLPKNPPAELLMEKPQCVECGKTFSSRKTYRYHLNVLHKGNNRYPCPRCGKIYQWKSNLGRHMRTHKAVDAGELYCDTCDKSFASVATYRQHLRISRRHVSENEFSFTCNDCGKKFVNKTRLRDHIDWEHLKKIKFRCQLCNKPFKCHTSLYVHLQNVHRNKEKKDNLCHVCGKSYQNAAKLKYHIIALHTGETPYQCSQCSAAFGWYSSLYRHVREVHYKVKAQPKKTKKDKKLENDPPIYMNYQT